MVDPVLRSSGLRAVAVATLLGIVVGVVRFALVLAQATGDVDLVRFELLQTSIGLSATTIGMLWIWGTIRAARSDDGLGGGLFALAATVACAAVVLDAFVTIEPLLLSQVRVGADFVSTLAAAGRICGVAAQIALVIALARLGWRDRRGIAMFGAAIALLVAGPLLLVDPVAMALERAAVSLAGSWWLGIVPPLLLGTGIVIAIWGLPVPTAPVWRAFGRSLELMRAALAGIIVVAALSMAAVALGAHPGWVRIAAVAPLALLGLATVVGALHTARRSIRSTRWSFAGAAMVITALVTVEALVGALVPFGVVEVPAELLALADLVERGVALLAIALLVFGSGRVDPVLRVPAWLAAVFVVLAVGVEIAAIVLRNHPMLQEIEPVLISGVVVLLGLYALVLTVRLLGKGVSVAEARHYGERVRAAQNAAKQARLVHERWREARRRATEGN